MAGQENEPEANMKNKNIRSKQTKERGQGKGLGSTIGNNIFWQSTRLQWFIGDIW